MNFYGIERKKKLKEISENFKRGCRGIRSNKEKLRRKEAKKKKQILFSCRM